MTKKLLLAFTMFVITTAARPAQAQREQAENPTYRNWNGFAPGTAVTYRSWTESAEGKSEVLVTYELLDRTEEKIVINMTTIAQLNDEKIKHPPQRLENRRFFRLPPGVSEAEFGKPRGVLAEGEETVEVSGRSFKTKWYRARTTGDAGETFTTSWSSEQIPGRLVKSISETPKTRSVTKVELVDVKIP